MSERSAVLARTLVTGALANAFIATRPDHPHLLLGPDLLIGADGRLVAIFLANETSQGSIRGRLIASRLALPSNTRMVLIAPDHGALNVNARDFDEIFAARA